MCYFVAFHHSLGKYRTFVKTLHSKKDRDHNVLCNFPLKWQSAKICIKFLSQVLSMKGWCIDILQNWITEFKWHFNRSLFKKCFSVHLSFFTQTVYNLSWTHTHTSMSLSVIFVQCHNCNDFFLHLYSESNNQEEQFDKILSGKYSFISPFWDNISASAKVSRTQHGDVLCCLFLCI